MYKHDLFVGTNKTRVLNSDDEIALSVKKNKGKIWLLSSS